MITYMGSRFIWVRVFPLVFAAIVMTANVTVAVADNDGSSSGLVNEAVAMPSTLPELVATPATDETVTGLELDRLGLERWWRNYQAGIVCESDPLASNCNAHGNR